MAERISKVPESKKKLVQELSKKIKESNTVLIASIKSLPTSQYQQIKKKLRGKAEVVIARKSLILRAISSSGKGAVNNLKDLVGSDFVLMFSEMDAFELSSFLTENQSPTKAKAGDIAPEDLKIEPGPTDLIPGPAISELGSVGLKVIVEGGKLAIRTGAVVAKKGQIIDAKVAGVLAKLNISPIKVGFIPVAAYDSKSDAVYSNIIINKEKILDSLRNLISKSLGFAVNVAYTTPDTIGYIVRKAGRHEIAINNLLKKSEIKEDA
jgi:large subunit ribosomal protein L10